MICESARHRPPSVRPLVAWYSGYRQEGVSAARHRGLPSPYLTLIITLDDPLTVAAHPDPRQPAVSTASWSAACTSPRAGHPDRLDHRHPGPAPGPTFARRPTNTRIYGQTSVAGHGTTSRVTLSYHLDYA